MYGKISTAILLIFVAHMEIQEYLFPATHAHSYGIRDFANTREPIWTYNTTKTEAVRCRCDQMRFIDPVFIGFNRTMLHNRRRVSLELLGQFSRTRVTEMFIFHGHVQLSTEILVFKTPDSSCGIIVTKSSVRNATFVDLRIRDSFIKGGPRRECRRKFSRIARTGRVIYRSSCSKELRKALL
ncbi:uncharacterized protein LOC119406995 [Rhipicephalus sanguineus]|uniref:uncharacterized protein LOC119406995 n=1 Tax=Rhipicephalus sanguineus TaxID=34632 RepID=UPI0018950C8B|nr:uncharacterized protein LOC119406995 [Rhipicephalus sanguineus]